MIKIFSKFKAAIKVAAIVILYYVFCFLFNITCPIYATVGIPCPCCGVTRALISLFKLDVEEYVRYNIMALPLVLALVIAMRFNSFRRKRAALVVVISILTVNLIYYLIRLFGILPQTVIFFDK